MCAGVWRPATRSLTVCWIDESPVFPRVLSTHVVVPQSSGGTSRLCLVSRFGYKNDRPYSGRVSFLTVFVQVTGTCTNDSLMRSCYFAPVTVLADIDRMLCKAETLCD